MILHWVEKGLWWEEKFMVHGLLGCLGGDIGSVGHKAAIWLEGRPSIQVLHTTFLIASLGLLSEILLIKMKDIGRGYVIIRRLLLPNLIMRSTLELLTGFEPRVQLSRLLFHFFRRDTLGRWLQCVCCNIKASLIFDIRRPKPIIRRRQTTSAVLFAT